MAQINTRGLENNAVTGQKMRLANAEAFRARNAANNADIDLFNLDNANVWQFTQLPKYSGSNIATESYVDSQMGSYIPTSEKGVSGGVATLDLAGQVPATQNVAEKSAYTPTTSGDWLVTPDNTAEALDEVASRVKDIEDSVGQPSGLATLDVSGKVPSAQLPSYVDDVVEYANLAAFPVTGETSKIYVAIDTGKAYRWSGSVYIEVSPSEVNSVNGQTGIVTLDSDDISEGATNLYFTSSRFNTSFSAKTTDDLSEGLTNLYHTDARAKSAAVVNSMAGTETDQAPSVSSVKAYIAANAGQVAVETFNLLAGDITNGYVDLAVEASVVFEVTPKGFPTQHPVDDYTLSVVSGKTRITFAGDMLLLQAGDKLKVAYFY